MLRPARRRRVETRATSATTVAWDPSVSSPIVATWVQSSQRRG